jgi:hypothetical protein
LSLAAGVLPPAHFNSSLLVFLPKGESELDAQEVVRSAKDTRPISLKNSDNKAVTGALVGSFQQFAKEHTHKSQNGFVHKRFFLRNVLDLDSAARLFSMRFLSQETDLEKSPELIPLLAFYDFAAAFPSVAHAWIFLVLEARKFPDWFVNSMRGIYHKAAAFADCGGDLVFLFEFLSGVLQGCPASAFLFNVSLDPFLEALESAFKKSKKAAVVTRACADDIGQAMRKLALLKVSQPVFELARKFAGLSLKPAKCKLIPLVRDFDHAKLLISSWLEQNLPAWKDFEVVPCAVYLGFFLGPRALSKQWEAPFKKFKQRVQAIAHARAPASITAYTYNSKAVPVLSYVAQLLPLPSYALKCERNALHSITHMATNAYTFSDFFGLSQFGAPVFRCIQAQAHAALTRAAIASVPHWPQWKRQLWLAASQSLSLADIAAERHSPTFWDTEAIAVHLSNAYSSFPRSDNFQTAVSTALGTVCNSIVPTDPKDFPPTHKLQAVVYKSILQSAVVSDPSSTILRRVRDLFAPYDTTVAESEIHKAKSLLRRLRKAEALMVLKTWGNSWSTSYRFHEPQLFTCLFGCPSCPDQLAHYVMCPWLFKIVSLLRPETPPNPLERIALENVTIESLKSVACTFAGYHAIKCTPTSLTLAHTSSTDSGAILGTAVSFADAFLAVARDVGLQCQSSRFFEEHFRHFLLSQDASFLTSHEET